MKHSYIALTILLSFFTSTPYSDAQTANVFFHQAAKVYIAGNFPEALRAVESGLQRDPANPKLQALRDKIKEQMEKQQQEQADSNQRDQQQGDEQKQDQQANQQQQNQPQDEEQKQPEQQPAGQQKDKEQLSKEDAARLLEALRKQEKEAQKQRQIKVQGRAQVEKDW